MPGLARFPRRKGRRWLFLFPPAVPGGSTLLPPPCWPPVLAFERFLHECGQFLHYPTVFSQIVPDEMFLRAFMLSSSSLPQAGLCKFECARNRRADELIVDVILQGSRSSVGFCGGSCFDSGCRNHFDRSHISRGGHILHLLPGELSRAGCDFLPGWW